MIVGEIDFIEHKCYGSYKNVRCLIDFLVAVVLNVLFSVIGITVLIVKKRIVPANRL